MLPSTRFDRHPQRYAPRRCAAGTPESLWSSWPWPRNAAATAIPKRMRIVAASRVRFAGLQKTHPALDATPLHECPIRYAGSPYHPLEIQERRLSCCSSRYRRSASADFLRAALAAQTSPNPTVRSAWRSLISLDSNELATGLALAEQAAQQPEVLLFVAQPSGDDGGVYTQTVCQGLGR